MKLVLLVLFLCHDVPLSRTERLLRDRELREKRRNNGRTLTLSEVEGDSSRQYVEQYLEGAGPARAHNDASERQESRPYNRQQQQLLAVANKLPVSAVRRVEDS